MRCLLWKGLLPPHQRGGVGVVEVRLLLREGGRGQVSRELEVLREEYKRAVENPTFDDPKDYCILLDLIQDRIEEIEEGENV